MVNGELLSDERRNIISLPILKLSDKLKSGKLTPLTVLEAYQVRYLYIFFRLRYSQIDGNHHQYLDVLFLHPQAKAIQASDDTNCVTDFINESREFAINLEKNIKEKDRGPLYGIPISVKECFYVGGYDATVGLVKHLNKPAQKDGGFVQVSLLTSVFWYIPTLKNK